MQLSRKADYALRALRFLSRLPKGEIASINQIAEHESIPREFIAKILKEITRQGIIHSFQGVKGGYRVARRPKDISYLQVIEAVNGPLHLNLCTELGGSYCDQVATCPIHAFWARQEDSMKRKLSGENFGKYTPRSKSSSANHPDRVESGLKRSRMKKFS